MVERVTLGDVPHGRGLMIFSTMMLLLHTFLEGCARSDDRSRSMLDPQVPNQSFMICRAVYV